MTVAKNILESVYRLTPTAKLRRDSLTKNMLNLSNQSISCSTCPGHCCSFQYNSMQIDPLQALELFDYVEQSFDENVWDKISETIKHFRLDNEPDIGRGKSFRRYYTCPFFSNEVGKGCTVSRHIKPYGCLGYNPLKENINSEGQCSQDIPLLEERENINLETEKYANEYIQKHLGIYWTKKSMPLALQEIRNKINEAISNKFNYHSTNVSGDNTVMKTNKVNLDLPLKGAKQ